MRDALRMKKRYFGERVMCHPKQESFPPNHKVGQAVPPSVSEGAQLADGGRVDFKDMDVPRAESGKRPQSSGTDVASSGNLPPQ